MPTALLTPVLGLLAWLALAAWQGQALRDVASLAELAVAFVALVVVPLVLAQTTTPTRAPVSQDIPTRSPAPVPRDSLTTPPWLAVPHALGALAVVLGAALLPTGGPASLALAATWLAFTALAAAHALTRFLPRSRHHLPELALDLALLFLPGAAAWLLVYRGELVLGGFGGLAAVLTAGHFHAAGFGALAMTGLLGRGLADARLPRARKLYTFVAPALMLAFPFLAAGIATAIRPIELTGAVLYAFGLPLLAALQLGAALHLRGRSPLARLLLAGSALAVLVATGFAVNFATQGFYGAAVEISTMLRWHALVNVIGFLGLGALGWALLRPPALAGPRGLPFSRLMSRGRVGADYFTRCAPGREPAPRGLVDTLSIYDRPGFTSAAVDPNVRAFYERTADHDLAVAPAWRFPWRLGGRVAHALGRLAGQMTIPLHTTGAQAMPSRIVAVDAAIDGRPGVRGWVRTLGEGGPPVYVAAYAAHRDPAGLVYMNIAFPLPRSNLASLLRIDHDPARPGAIVLTTCAVDPDDRGDQGIFLVTAAGPLRVPMNETIWVWADPDGPLRARHQVWLLGLTCVVLEYTITTRP